MDKGVGGFVITAKNLSNQAVSLTYTFIFKKIPGMEQFCFKGICYDSYGDYALGDSSNYKKYGGSNDIVGCGNGVPVEHICTGDIISFTRTVYSQDTLYLSRCSMCLAPANIDITVKFNGKTVGSFNYLFL